MRGATGLLLVSAMALCACGKHASDAPKASASAASPGGTSTVPARRAGLWEEAVTRDGVASSFMSKLRFCVDPAQEGKISAMVGNMGRRGCGQNTYVRTATGYTFAVTCKLPGSGTIVSHGAMTGDLNQAYKVHIQSEISGAPLAVMNGAHVTDMEAQYLGPCPPDMHPGDVRLNNGMKFDAARMGASGVGAGG
jgi:hypothetical protein